MGEVTFGVSVPFTDEQQQRIKVLTSTTLGALLERARQLFQSVSIENCDILVSLKDGTYTFASPDEVISSFSLPEEPSILLARKEFSVTVEYEKVKPIEITVANNEPVDSVLLRVCKQVGSLKPKHFVVCIEETKVIEGKETVVYDVLVNSMSIVEQRPDAKKLTIMEADSDKVKLNFMELYLRGPVYLSLSDALQLSAYLLQATKGPYRCFNGTHQALTKFIPIRFRDTSGIGEDLRVQWSFLEDCTKEEAMRKFKKNVQALPLFNCTSFTCERRKKDKESKLPEKEFELIFTERRMIFLDFIKFKSRMSIPYRDLLSVERQEGKAVITYWENGEVKEVTVKTATSRSLFQKLVEIVVDLETAEKADMSQPYVFRTKEDIENDKNRIEYFPTDFIYDFINMDEKEERIQYSECMQALFVRADACAWHLSVLLSKVTKNNAKLLRNEITAYYTRLMAYLTWLTYDQRPYDVAVPIGEMIPTLEETFEKARATIRDVCQLMGTVRKMFVPISNDPIYLAAKEVIGYVIGHLFSYIEMPYATKDKNTEPFDDLIKKFLENSLLLKEHINTYMFTVGDLAVKKSMQTCLDFVFMHHLSSLSKFPLIIDSSVLGQLDPTIILHQDSCNIMMSAIVEFSRVLWEDRKQLTDDQLQAFLEQAAQLVRTLLPIEKPLAVHIKAIEEFLKLVDLNLPGLTSTIRMCFLTFKEYAEKLIGSFERVKACELPHMLFQYVQTLSVLIFVHPDALMPEMSLTLQRLESIGKEAYLKLTSELPTFDLFYEEGKNPNAAALRIYVAENLKPEVEGKTIVDLVQSIFPVMSLQQIIGRVVSEWCTTLLRILVWQVVFVEGVAAKAIYYTRTKVAAGEWEASEDTKKKLGDLTNFDEYGIWLPVKNSEPILAVMKLLEADSALTGNEAFAPVMQILKFATEANVYFTLPKVSTPEGIKQLNDTISLMSQLFFSGFSALLRTNLPAAMTRFPQMYYTAVLFYNVLREMAFQPAYFQVPKLMIKMGRTLKALEYGAVSFFSSGKLNAIYMAKFQGFGKRIRRALLITEATDMTSLYPIEEFKKPAALDAKAKASRRTDMADLIADYRVLKNELVECLMLHEKENLEIVAERLGEAAGKIIALTNLVDAENQTGPMIASGFAKFAEELPVIYSYKQSAVHVRASLEKLDSAIDDAVDDTAGRLYEEVTPQRLNDLSESIEKEKWEPSDRAAFIHSFTELLQPMLSQLQDSEEMQVIFDILNLVQDNEIGEVKFLVSTLSEPKSETLLKCIKDSKYCKYVRKIEKEAEKVEYSPCFIWYKAAVKKIAEILKFRNESDDGKEAMSKLANDLNETFSPDKQCLERCAKNIQDARSKLDIPELKALEEQCEHVQETMPKLIQTAESFDSVVLSSKDFNGMALTYKDSIRQIINFFYQEYLIQDWQVQPFVDVCSLALVPLSNGYSSETVADALIGARRLMRKLRLTERTVRASFVTECDKLLTKAEQAFREFYAKTKQAEDAHMRKHKTVVDGIIGTFEKLNDSNIKRFVVRLISNLSLDLSTMNTFDSALMSQKAAELFNDLKASNDRSVQVKALIRWVEGMDTGILPVDYERLLDILRKLLETLDAPEDESMFSCDQDALIELAVKLSSALAQLGAIRNSLALVKDMHKLYSIKDGMLKYITTVMRTFEAYAEEIHVFPMSAHPVMGVIESIPVMCEKLENMIEASFMLTYTKRHAEEAVDSLKAFVASCPKDVHDTMEALIEEPIQLIMSVGD